MQIWLSIHSIPRTLGSSIAVSRAHSGSGGVEGGGGATGGAAGGAAGGGAAGCQRCCCKPGSPSNQDPQCKRSQSAAKGCCGCLARSQLCCHDVEVMRITFGPRACYTCCHASVSPRSKTQTCCHTKACWIVAPHGRTSEAPSCRVCFKQRQRSCVVFLLGVHVHTNVANRD